MLRSDLCVYFDAYIIVKGKITVNGGNDNAAYNDKRLALKNNASFISCMSKSNNILIDNPEDLNIVMATYNLIECGKNYSNRSGGLWNYYRDEPNSSMVCNINYSITNSNSFDYKTSITGKLEGTDKEKTVKIVVPLKHLSNIWRALDMPLINCEVSLTLTWSASCVITNETYREANPDADHVVTEINAATNAMLDIKDTKLSVPIVTLSNEDDNL